MMSHVQDALTVDVSPTGRHALLSAILPSSWFVKFIVAPALRKAYMHRPWPDKPVVVQLASGQRFEVRPDEVVAWTPRPS